MQNVDQKQAWDANAKAWYDYIHNAVDPNHDEIITPHLDKLLGEVKGLRVLDLGCGEGSFSRFLSRLGARVTGIDFSEEMIKLAKMTEPDCKVDYRVGSAHDIDGVFSKEARFDICVANMSLFCMSDLKLVIHKIRKILKPKGIFVFATLHPCFPLRIYSTSARTIANNLFNNPEQIEWPEDSYFNTREKYRKITPQFPYETVTYIRMIEQYSEYLCNENFKIEKIIEPRPTQSIINNPKHLSKELYTQFPFFLLVRASLDNRNTGNGQSKHSVIQQFLKFRDDRNWAQFQTIKNTAISLCIESSELLEHFHWLNDESEVDQYIEKNKPAIEEEMADIYMNLLLLAHDLNISLDKVASEKIEYLKRKYTIIETKGRSVPPGKKR